MLRGRVSGTSRPALAAYSPRSGRREEYHQQVQHDYEQSQPGNPHVVPAGHGWPYQASRAPATHARNTSLVPSSPPYSPPEVIGGDDIRPTLPDEGIAVKIEDGIGEVSALGESRKERGNGQRSASAPPPAGGRSRNMYYQEKVDQLVLPDQGQESTLIRSLPGELDETEVRKAIDLTNAAIEYQLERDSTHPAHDNPSTRSPEPERMPPTPRRASRDHRNDSSQASRPPGPRSELIKDIIKMQEYLEIEGVQEDTIIRVLIEALTAKLERRSTMSGNVPANEILAAKTMGLGEGSRGSQVEARKAEVSPTLQPSSPLVSTSERRPASEEPNESSHRNHPSDSPGSGSNNEPTAKEVALPASEPLKVGGRKRRCESDGGGGGHADSKRQRGGESSVGLSGVSEFGRSVQDGKAKARRMSSRIRKRLEEW